MFTNRKLVGEEVTTNHERAFLKVTANGTGAFGNCCWLEHNQERPEAHAAAFLPRAAVHQDNMATKQDTISSSIWGVHMMAAGILVLHPRKELKSF